MPTETPNVTFVGNRVFPEVIMVRLLRSDHPGLEWVLHSIAGVLAINRKEEDTQRHGRESHVKTEAQIGITYLQAKKHQELLAATRS